jgi:hypothetical protein
MPITFVIVTLFMNQARKSEAVAATDIDLEFVEYGMTNKIWEMEKFLYCCLIFYFMPFLNLYYYLAGICLFLMVKPSTGGLHVQDIKIGPLKLPAVWHCFTWTLLTFIAGTYLLPRFLSINNLGVTLIAIFCITVTFLISPVRNAAEEELADKTKDKQKKWTATIVTTCLFALFISYDSLFNGRFILPTIVPVWLLFINNVQMLIVIYNKREKI